MKDIKEAFKYKEEYDKIISDEIQDDYLYLRIKASSTDGGINTCKKLYDSLYTYEEEGKKNVSPTYDFEIWYENGVIKFFFHTKKQDAQLHLRKQLSVNLPESEFQVPERKMINISKDDYIVCANIKLKRPFFEPISTNNDPYENIFAEFDNKDETKVIIQHLFKPAEPDWTDTMKESAEEYAERLKNREKSIKKKFGLDKRKISDDSATEEARLVEQQVGEKGFNVKMRLLISNPNKRKLLETVKHLNNMYELEFEAPSGQTLTIEPIKKEKNINKFFKKLSSRNSKDLTEYRGLKDSLRELTNPLTPGNIYTEKVIMSSEELSNIAHIPSESAAPNSPIAWSRIPSARIPPELKDFPDLEQNMKKNIVKELMEERQKFREKLKKQKNYKNTQE